MSGIADDVAIVRTVISTLEAHQQPRDAVVYRTPSSFRVRFSAPIDNIRFIEVEDVRIGTVAFMHNIDHSNNTLHLTLQRQFMDTGGSSEEELYISVPKGRYWSLCQLVDALNSSARCVASDIEAKYAAAGKVTTSPVSVSFHLNSITKMLTIASGVRFNVHTQSSSIAPLLGLSTSPWCCTAVQQADTAGSVSYAVSGSSRAFLPLTTNYNLYLRIPEIEDHVLTTPLPSPGAALVALDTPEAYSHPYSGVGLAAFASDLVSEPRIKVIPLITKEGFTTMAGRVDRLTFEFTHLNGQPADLSAADISVHLKFGFVCPRPNVVQALGQLNPYIPQQDGAAVARYLQDRYDASRYE